MKNNHSYMNKILKISLNILIFALIVGFGYYMVSSITKEAETFTCNKSCGDCPQRAHCGIDVPQPIKSNEPQSQCACKQKIKDYENE